MTATTIDHPFRPTSAPRARDLFNDRSPAMYASTELRLRNAQALRQGDLKAAANARLLRAHRAVQARPIRARIGRSIIRIGERLAAEPHLEPARPRGGPGGRPPPEDTTVTVLTHELRASYAFVERNFFLTRRYWGWELAFLVYSVAGALSISLIGAAAGDPRLILSLMIGAIFWNYLSVVFSWIAETIAVERWEGTLEYTMMAPVRRWTQLLGSCLYAMLYGLVHTAAILLVLVLFFPELELTQANVPAAAAFMLLGSFSFVGIGIMAAILPLLYVERGAQMTFVLQSCLLLVSGVYYPIEVLPPWMQVLSHLSPATYVLEGVRGALIDGLPLTSMLDLVWPLVVMGVVLIPTGLWAFGRAERYAKRTGKLKRVG